MIGRKVGRYEVIDRVGRGGMGTVYRAIDESLQREVALKVLNAGLDDPELARRFRAEAVTVARLNHPAIARIFELFEHDGQWLMAIELVPGETLERVIARDGAVAVDRASVIAKSCLAALAHAHALGIVHRDLKPANIMITPDGEVKLMDFGLARALDSDRITQVGFMMGTPAYMAPEQVLGEDIDARADLYAMGVVLYRMVTGTLPFSGDTPFAIAQAQIHTPPTPVRLQRPEVPAWMSAVIDRALAKAPAARFQTADAFAAAIDDGLHGRTVAAAEGAAAPGETFAPGRVDADADMGGVLPRRFVDWRVLAGVGIGAVAISSLLYLSRSQGSPAEPVVDGPQPIVEPAAGIDPEPAPETVSALSLPAAEVPDSVPESAAVPQPVDPPPAPAAPPSPAESSAASSSDEALVVDVPRVKVMMLDGRKAEDVDVMLRLSETGFEALGPGTGDAALAAWSYNDVEDATYVHARNPRWNGALASPPDDLDVGGLFRRSRHWLTLQKADDFIILRLEDTNIIQVVRELEARTGLAIRRPAGDAAE